MSLGNNIGYSSSAKIIANTEHRIVRVTWGPGSPDDGELWLSIEAIKIDKDSGKSELKLTRLRQDDARELAKFILSKVSL
jgi:hypothetical protein